MKAIKTIEKEVMKIKKELDIEYMTCKYFLEVSFYGVMFGVLIYMMSVLCYIFQ